MNWFIWRQHRKQFLTLGILLALFAAIVIPSGLYLSHTYHQAVLNCAQNPATPSCNDLSRNLFQSTTDQVLLNFLPLVTLFLPLLLGMFWGAPLLAKEYMEGTNSLAWTQSVSRRKWLTAKLVWILLASAVFLAAFTALITWWTKTPDTLNMHRGFSQQGIMPIAYGLFAVAVGVMFGAWFRKTMTAVAITLGLFVAAQIPIANFVRPHYMQPITVTSQLGPNLIDAKIPKDAWLVKHSILDKNGKSFNSFDISKMPAECQKFTQNIQVSNGGHLAKLKAEGVDPVDDCLNRFGYYQSASYQPSYRYWDFQFIEAGIYASMAALAVGATYWLVLKRDA